MLTDNNQIFRNCFVIIYCHLTKVSSQINKCIIFEPNELSITLSTLWYHYHHTKTPSGECKQRKVAKQPTEYTDVHCTKFQEQKEEKLVSQRISTAVEERLRENIRKKNFTLI